MSDLIPERPDRAIARLLAAGLDEPIAPPPADTEAWETLRICDAYGWTPAQVDELPPWARRRALDFLSSRTAIARRDPLRHLHRARWAIRHAIWQRRHRTKHA